VGVFPFFQSYRELVLSESSVLIVAYHFPPVAGSSGLHRMVSLSRELLRAGFQVHVLSVSLNCYAHVEEANLATLHPDVMVHRVRAFDSVKALSLGGKYPSLLKTPDSFQSWIVSGAWQGLRLVRRHGIRWVISTYPIASAHCIGYCISRWSDARWIADFRMYNFINIHNIHAYLLTNIKFNNSTNNSKVHTILSLNIKSYKFIDIHKVQYTTRFHIILPIIIKLHNSTNKYKI
jgi:hypothetical protein